MSTQPTVLVVDDDPGILKLVQLELLDQDMSVLTAATGDDALRVAEEHDPDLIVLDVVLPDASGLDVMRRLRDYGSTPIILLTAMDRDADKVRGLDLGADDYLAKPFNPEELTARIRAVLRRAQQPAASRSVLHVHDVEIDLDRRLVRRAGEVVQLTKTEWGVLQVLAENAGKVMVSTQILSRVWGPEYQGELQYLRVWISRLRSKLEPDRGTESLVKTFPGVGYMLVAPVAPVLDAPRD